MEEQAARSQAEEEVKGSAADEASGDGEEEEAEEEEDEEDNFINNHDLIGVKGIIAAQKNEIEQKKVSIVTAPTATAS